MTMPNLWAAEDDWLAEVFEGRGQKGKARGLPAPEAWPAWLAALFPAYVTAPFAERHEEFWDWAWSIDLASAPRSFVAIWPRGGAKSTSAELAATAMGVRGKRRYAWYVSETQDQADTHVGNIGALLESDAVERHYPDHADRLLSKYGTSRGWRRNRLRTSGGFTVDALGLDTASRGVKLEEQRPDLIILDDIDNTHDTPAATARKIATITKAVLPSGAGNVAVLAIQNLIIPGGFFTRMVDGRADYLADRIVSGPHPAVAGLETEWRWDEAWQRRRAVVVAGQATWAGQGLAECQSTIDRIGLSAFRKECQHLVKDRSEGLAIRYDETRHLESLTDEECRQIVAMGECFGGLDIGHWRWAFVLRAVDRLGRVHQIDEIFSQRELAQKRAERLDAMLRRYGVPASLRIWGDSANPQDIAELNAALVRVAAGLEGKPKPYRVLAVMKDKGIRTAAVDRVNDLLDRGLFFYRAEAAAGATWRLGLNAQSEGTEMDGSRLVWETLHWEYPVPKEGTPQVQDPEDGTADGADMQAADRYGVMSWWKAARPAPDPPPDTRNTDYGLQRLLERLEQANHDTGGIV